MDKQTQDQFILETEFSPDWIRIPADLVKQLSIACHNTDLAGFQYGDLEIFKEVMSMYGTEHGLGFGEEGRRRYNAKHFLSQGPDFHNKKAYLEKVASIDGFCFVFLILAVSEVVDLTYLEFERAVNLFIRIASEPGSSPDKKTRKYKQGMEVVTQLTVIKRLCWGGTMADILSEDDQTFTTAMESLLNSSGRMHFKDNSGVIHLENPWYDVCEHGAEIWCEHGFSTRYFITLFGSKDVIVGGTQINFADFEESFADAATTIAPRPLINESGFRVHNHLGSEPQQAGQINLTPGSTEEVMAIKQENQELQKLRRQLESEIARLKLTEANKAVREVHLEELRSVNEQLQEEIETLLPSDSRTNVESYGKRYMGQGTIIQPGTIISTRGSRRANSQMEDHVVAHRLQTIPEVVVGYQRTASLHAIDNQTRQSVRPINGLANPFRSDRLNLLSHLHTAFIRLGAEDSGRTILRLIEDVVARENRSPTMILFAQVIRLTFDFEGQYIKSNPFGLPYLEVGMALTEDCVIKCFDLLLGEYKSIWFQELKSLIIPEFNKDYRNLSDETFRRTHRSSSARRHSTSSSKGTSIFSK
jgi:hypothetical protein